MSRTLTAWDASHGQLQLTAVGPATALRKLYNQRAPEERVFTCGYSTELGAASQVRNYTLVALILDYNVRFMHSVHSVEMMVHTNIKQMVYEYIHSVGPFYLHLCAFNMN